jgi:hypothetical protein
MSQSTDDLEWAAATLFCCLLLALAYRIFPKDQSDQHQLNRQTIGESRPVTPSYETKSIVRDMGLHD